jgi:hypothetical protein
LRCIFAQDWSFFSSTIRCACLSLNVILEVDPWNCEPIQDCEPIPDCTEPRWMIHLFDMIHSFDLIHSCSNLRREKKNICMVYPKKDSCLQSKQWRCNKNDSRKHVWVRGGCVTHSCTQTIKWLNRISDPPTHSK